MDGASQVVRLRLDASAGAWDTVVKAGVSEGMIIRSRAIASGPRELSVDVRFLLPRKSPLSGFIGRRMQAAYATLYDEDEAMMLHRQAALDSARKPSKDRKRLGNRAVLLRPWFIFEWGRRRFRVVELDGRLRSFSVRCAHMLGPLDDCPVQGGEVVCPWHGYRFDIRTGRCEGRPHRLLRAPMLRRDGEGCYLG